MDKANMLASAYLDAKEALVSSGDAAWLDWQAAVDIRYLEERAFLQEAAWVILSTGLSASVVTRVFPRVSDAFMTWRNAAEISSKRSECREDALSHFRNKRKIDAIIEIAERVHVLSFETLKSHIIKNGVSYLVTLPYIGPVTAYHLAKNIGMDVAKPDRHLVRLAGHLGYESAAQLCGTIAEVVGDRVSVVDLVLWRYVSRHGITPTMWGHESPANWQTTLYPVPAAQVSSGKANSGHLQIGATCRCASACHQAQLCTCVG